MMKGVHGTCRSSALSIYTSGFTASTAGKRGAGAYLWGYTQDELKPSIRELACNWWRYSNKQGNYSKFKDRRCAVVYVSLSLVEDDILDLESQVVRDNFVIYSKKVLDQIPDYKEKDISAVYDQFVADLEKTLSQSFKIVHVKVQRPNGRSELLPDMDISGQPSCYVVKDLTCIAIDGTEEIDYE
jgi:hypothetical protein